MTKPIQQAIAWWCFSPEPLAPERFIRTARELGFDGLEMVPEEYRQIVRDAGLQLASAVGHASISQGLNRREHHPRIEREILASIREAERWKIPNLICFSGERKGLDDVTGAEITAEGLLRVARTAEKAGVNLVLELLNSKRDHPDYQCDNTAWGVRVCEWVGSPRVKLLYDVYHAQIMEGDVIATIREQGRHFAHYHTAGCPGRHEMNDSQELNYPAILKAIRETGFQGWIGHEFIPTADPVIGLRHARGLLPD